MTIDLEALEDALAKATPGPYSVRVTSENEVHVVALDPRDPDFPWHFCPAEWDCDDASPKENAAAIVASLSAAPAMIATIQTQADRVRVLEEALGNAERWLANLRAIDLDEIVADGGITAGMVIQQEAALMESRARAALGDKS